MQNKLNEILELCIEKSSHENGIFYGFNYMPYSHSISVNKFTSEGKRSEIYKKFNEENINHLLEYMQNE